MDLDVFAQRPASRLKLQGGTSVWTCAAASELTMAAIAMTQSNLLVIDSLSNSHRSNSHSRGPVTQPWSGKIPLRQKTSRLTGVA